MGRCAHPHGPGSTGPRIHWPSAACGRHFRGQDARRTVRRRPRRWPPGRLAAVAVGAAVERAGVDAGEIEDVYFGCANQAGEDNRNVARMAALLAGCRSVAGVTINRLCASGLSAVVSACHAVVAGDGDLFVAGGVESMSRAPLVRQARQGVPARRPDGVGHHARLALPEPAHGGDVPARVDGRDRRERGRVRGRHAGGSGCVRARTQQRYAEARPPGGSRRDRLQSARWSRRTPAARTSAEKLAALKPAFRADGR